MTSIHDMVNPPTRDAGKVIQERGCIWVRSDCVGIKPAVVEQHLVIQLGWVEVQIPNKDLR